MIPRGPPGAKKAGSTSSFPSGPPPQYSSCLKLFNFGVRMGSGAFSLVWPTAKAYPYKSLIYTWFPVKLHLKSTLSSLSRKPTPSYATKAKPRHYSYSNNIKSANLQLHANLSHLQVQNLSNFATFRLFLLIFHSSAPGIALLHSSLSNKIKNKSIISA